MDDSNLTHVFYIFTTENSGIMEMAAKPGSVVVKSVEDKKDHQDCLVCILRPILIIGAFIGVSPIAYSCPHHGKSQKMGFRRSWTYYIYTGVLLVSVVTMLVHNFFYLSSTIMWNAKDKIIQLATLVLFELITIVIYINILIQIQDRVKAMNGLAAIIESKHLFNIDKPFFEKKTIKYFKRVIIIYIIIALTLLILHATHVYLLFGVGEKTNNLYLSMRGLSSCLSLLAQTIYMFQYTIELKVYRHMLKRNYEIIKEELNCRLGDTTQHWAERCSSTSDIQFHKFVNTNNDYSYKVLQKLQRLHCAIIVNLRQFNKYLNPMVLLTVSITVLLLIMSYYLIIRIWMTGNSHRNGMYYMLEFKTLAIIFVVIHLLIVTNSLQDPVSKNFMPLCTKIFK